MIYFARAVGGGLIKIGCSEDVDRRLRQLEFNYGCRLELLHTMEGGPEVEAEVHARFSHLRAGRTEQFFPNPELFEYMNNSSLADTNPNTMEVMAPRTFSLASLKGSEKYREWLEGLAEHSHLPVAILIEHALREYAENHGYEKAQPKR